MACVEKQPQGRWRGESAVNLTRRAEGSENSSHVAEAWAGQDAAGRSLWAERRHTGCNDRAGLLTGAVTEVWLRVLHLCRGVRCGMR